MILYGNGTLDLPPNGSSGFSNSGKPWTSVRLSSRIHGVDLEDVVGTETTALANGNPVEWSFWSDGVDIWVDCKGVQSTCRNASKNHSRMVC